MTKKIVIMNGDTADFKVIIEVLTTNSDGTESIVETKEINHPAEMIDIMLWSGRKIVIRENGYSDYAYMKKELINANH